jgi:hypothetical protein
MYFKVKEISRKHSVGKADVHWPALRTTGCSVPCQSHTTGKHSSICKRFLCVREPLRARSRHSARSLLPPESPCWFLPGGVTVATAELHCLVFLPRNRSSKPCIGWITAPCGRPPGLRSAPAEKLHSFAATLQVNSLILSKASPSLRFTLRRQVLRIPPFPLMFRKQPTEGNQPQRIVVSSSPRLGARFYFATWHFVCRLPKRLRVVGHIE